MFRLSFLAWVFLSLFADGVVYSQKKSDAERLRLTGDVKMVETFTISFDAEKGWTNRQPWISETFNRDGNSIERTVYQNGQLYDRVVTFYDERGRKTGNDSFSASLDKTMTVPSKTELVLDAAGNVSELRVYARPDKSKIDVRHVFKYDGRGNQIERDYGAAGKSVITYDANDNETSQTNSRVSGAIYGKTLTEYDAPKRKTKLTIYSYGMFYEDARLRYEITYKYDEKDRIVEMETKEFNIEPNVVTSHAPEPGKIVYRYDDAKRAVETERYTSDGYLKDKSFVIRDERGSEIGFECAEADLKTCRRILEYIYDARGNWTKKTMSGREYSGGTLRPYHAEERTIGYY